MSERQDRDSVVGAAAAQETTAMVRVVYLWKFAELVTQLGGDPDRLLSKLRLEPGVLDNRNAMIPYRTLVNLLERAAADLGCSDFGMRLAAIQASARVLGPLGIAMHNAPTVGEAFRYCAEHVQAYTPATQISLEKGPAADSVFMRFEILLGRLPYQRQVVEQSLSLAQHNVRNLSRGKVGAREIWFTHEPLSPLRTYRTSLGAPVRFGCSTNGLVFDGRDLEVPIADRDPQIYELATSFVDRNFPPTEPVLGARVRAIVERLLLAGDCTLAGVASKLGMHPRTLQRRLRADGESFEKIKDGVRRDIALRYIKQSSLPLMRVAEILGYSETSVLSRSCYRWFSASPRQLRGGRAGDARVGGRARPLEH